MSLLSFEAANTVGNQFVQHYYQTFSRNRGELGALYGADSIMTYEDVGIQGQTTIMGHLNGLKFEKIMHVPVKIDIQPSPGNGVIIFVTGNVSIDAEKPLKFSQTFNLQPLQNGGYFIFNEFFRLNLG